MTVQNILKGMIGASLFLATVPAIAAPAPVDLTVADRQGTSSIMNVRIFNASTDISASAYGVTVTVQPIPGMLAGLFAPSNCTRGGNGSYSCALYRVDAQYAKFASFGIVLSPTACSAYRNGQIKVATATVASNNPDTNASNNSTNVYIQTSCPR